MKIIEPRLKKLISEYLDEEPEELFRHQIENLSKNPEQHYDELLERLGQNLCFGTAGLRGKMEAGYNRMNLVSTFRLAYAVAQEIDEIQEKKLVVLGFDGRNNSYKFAKEISFVLSNIG